LVKLMWSVGFEPTKAVSKTSPRPAIKTEVFQFPSRPRV
jgi:hypothetical protein